MTFQKDKLLLGEFLRKARKAKGLSQTELAREIGFRSGQNISDWERCHGPRIPTPMLKKIIEVLNLNMLEVYELYLTDEKKRIENKIRREWEDC